MYLQGLSSSLPEEVQIELYKTIDCLKNVKMYSQTKIIQHPTGTRKGTEQGT